MLVAHAKVGGTSMADTFVNIVSPTAKPTEVKTTNETTTDKGKLPQGLVDQIPGMVLSNVGRIPDTAPARPITGSAPTTEQGTPPPKVDGEIKFAPISEFTGSPQASPTEVSTANVVVIEKELALAKKFVENTPESKVKLQKQLKENVVLLENELRAEKDRVLSYDKDGKRKASK
jgi:hypothetical protein